MTPVMRGTVELLDRRPSVSAARPGLAHPFGQRRPPRMGLVVPCLRRRVRATLPPWLRREALESTSSAEAQVERGDAGERAAAPPGPFPSAGGSEEEP